MWRRILWLPFWLCLGATAWGDIECPNAFLPYEPIVVSVVPTNVPAGARLRGSFSIADGQYIQAAENSFHCWAKPGPHLLSASGVWCLTKSVTVEGQTLDVLVDFGSYSYTKTIVVGGDDPVPPPLPGTRWSVIWEETDSRTPQQGNLFLDLRKQYPSGQVQVHDVTNLPPSLRALESQRPPNLALPVQMVLVRQTDGTDKVVRTVPLPSDVAGFAKELTQ